MPRRRDTASSHRHTTANVPDYFFRIYDASQHIDPSKNGFVSRAHGAVGGQKSSPIDERDIERHILTGFCSHVESPFLSGSASYLWTMFECERRLAYGSIAPENLRVAVISRMVLDKLKVLYLDISGPQWHPLARHAAEVLVKDSIPASSITGDFAYMDVRQGTAANLAPFLSRTKAQQQQQQHASPITFLDLYHANLPSTSQPHKHSFRSIFDSFWSRLPGEDALEAARWMGQVAQSHWVRVSTSLHSPHIMHS